MSNPFHPSDATALALHAAAYLAAHPDCVCPAPDISGALGVSHDHLVKVLQKLARAGLVETMRGPRGGVRLARDAKTIRLMDVYEAIEGRYTPVGCLLRKQACDGRHCVLGGLAEKLNRDIHEYLTGTPVASLAGVVKPATTKRGPPKTKPNRSVLAMEGRVSSRP